MKLRKLKIEDASLMLEWMHDKSVVKDMQDNFTEKTIEDCRKFIIKAEDAIHDLHLAIIDDEDIYMGTVSLKNIKDATAEFAIVIRKSAMGKGYSEYGMREIIRIGFEELGLKQIYWYVNKENSRAVRFYDKNGYKRADTPTLKICSEDCSIKQVQKYIWYSIQKLI